MLAARGTNCFDLTDGVNEMAAVPEGESKRMFSLLLGKIQIIPLLDGPLPYSLDKIPDPSHRLEAEEIIAKADLASLTMPVYAFLLKFDDRIVLIDTGSGRLGYDTLGRLPECLKRLGIAAEDVTDILMTHLHRDHYGGLVRNGTAAFPRANLIIYKREADFWLNTDLKEMPERGRRTVDEVRRVVALYAGRVRTVGNEDLFPGIRPLPSPGHTPGHICWEVTSEKQTLVAWGDVIHVSQIHLPAPYIAMEYDLNPEAALKTRLSMLDWVSENNVIVAGAHLPEPGVWMVLKGAYGHELQSVELTRMPNCA